MEPEAAPTRRRLGDFDVHPIGFGAARVSIEGRPSREQGVRVVMAAVTAGATLVDTADAYCVDSSREHGYGERLVADALSRLGSAADHVVVATKGGEVRPGDGSWRLRGHPDHLRSACESSLRTLGVEVIDLYQLHRPDPAVPLEDSLGAMSELQEAGLVRELGVCNVTASELEVALGAVRLVSVQNPYWLGASGQDRIIDRCREADIAFIAHSPFGGPGGAARLDRDTRLAGVAKRRGVAAHTVALAWLLERSPGIIPIPGTTDPTRPGDNAAAAGFSLTSNDRASLTIGPSP